DQGAGQAVQRAALALVVRALDLEDAVLTAVHGDGGGHGVGQGALGALDGHQAVVDGDVDTRRDRDGELANARHSCVLLLVSSLPDVGEDFPTHALLVGLAVGQQALAGRDDRDTQSAEHLRKAGALGVDPEAWLADAAYARNGALAVATELEGDVERLAHL